MSDGSNTSSRIILEPLRHIGAQDILKIEGRLYDGILRKRGAVDKFFGSTKWKQRFVVISQGCVYCFKDEYSQKPLSAFSLMIYESVREEEIAGVLNCFEIVHEMKGHHSHYFACETEDKRKAWISYLQDAISQAHMYSSGKLSGDSDEGICLQSSHKQPPPLEKRRSRGALPPLPPTPNEASYGGESVQQRKYKAAKSEYDLESEDEDQEPYHTVKEVEEACLPSSPKSLPGQVQVLPVVAGLNADLKKKRQTSISSRPPAPIPKPSSLTQTDTTTGKTPEGRPVAKTVDPKGAGIPDYLNEVFKKPDYFLDSKDREDVKRKLLNKPVGTFLVRRGNSTPMVLCVVTNQGSKDFQIFEENGKVTLNKAAYFPSIDALLTYYSQNYLPKNEYAVKLLKGYAA